MKTEIYPLKVCLFGEIESGKIKTYKHFSFIIWTNVLGKYEPSVSEKPVANSKQSIFDSLTSELEAIIGKLTQINDQVVKWIDRIFTDFHAGLVAAFFSEK